MLLLLPLGQEPLLYPAGFDRGDERGGRRGCEEGDVPPPVPLVLGANEALVASPQLHFVLFSRAC